MIRKYFSLLIVTMLLTGVLAAVMPARADQVRIWEADSGLGGITDKAKINSYLDNLKAHYVNGVWVQVELYSDGTVNYKKTIVSHMPTAKKFTTGQWASDDFLTYVISQAKARGMKVMIKFHGSNQAAWDQHPDWRKLNSKGKEVLWSGTLKNFCINSPFWDKMFLPMVREVAENYDVDGIYVDNCQFAYGGSDECFCQYCKARFEKETGKKLPLKPVDKANWTDPSVKLYAIKRTEWVNDFYPKFEEAVHAAKPAIEVLLNFSGGYNSYKDGSSARHMGKYATTITPEPVNTPRMYAAVKNHDLVKAKQKPQDEDTLAQDELLPFLNRYGYMEYMTKLMMAEGEFKPVVPISRYWFTDDSGMAPTNLAIKEIESSIGAGGRGWCFFGYLAQAMDKGATKKGAWADPKFTAYLKDLATGPRSAWVADMHPDSHIAILVDRDADYWTGDYWKRLQDVGRLYSYLQYQRKLSIGLIATSEPNLPGYGQTGYKLTKDLLSQYSLVICPGLDYASAEDLQALKDYFDAGGKLIIMGSIGRHGKFLGDPVKDDPYRLLGLSTDDPGEPSGFIQPTDARHPIFQQILFNNVGKSFRYSDDKDQSTSYPVKYSSAYDVWANEFADSGKHAAILYTNTSHYDPKKGAICYVNCADFHACTSGLLMILMNGVVVIPARADSLIPVHFSAPSSVNVFKSADGMTRYIHINTPEGENEKCFLRVKANPNCYPISAEMIVNGGAPKQFPIVVENRNPNPGEMVIAARGNGVLKTGVLPSGFAMIKIVYEHRDFPISGD